MKNYPLWKIFLVFILVSLGVIFAIPSILYQEDTGNWYLDNRLNLGLDLQGGSYLLLEVQTDVLIQEEFENFSDTIRMIARENRIKINNIDQIDEELKIRFDPAENLEDIKNSFLQNYRSVKFNISNNVATISIDQLYKKSIQDSAIKQSLEIVRKRIDESGTKEPLIQRSGSERILLQLPGVKNPERIKDLLGKTAKLNFHMVDDDDSKSLSLNIAPFGKMIVSDINNEELKYLLEKKSRVGGENLIDANASFDPTEGHAVSFRFDTTGAQKFGKATSENIGKRFKIRSDDNIDNILQALFFEPLNDR